MAPEGSRASADVTARLPTSAVVAALALPLIRNIAAATSSAVVSADSYSGDHNGNERGSDAQNGWGELSD